MVLEEIGWGCFDMFRGRLQDSHAEAMRRRYRLKEAIQNNHVGLFLHDDERWDDLEIEIYRLLLLVEEKIGIGIFMRGTDQGPKPSSVAIAATGPN